MKKRIVIGLGAYSIIMILAGLYVLSVIERATTKLDELIVLHQVEILREHFLIQLRSAQTDLTLRDTPHARDFDTMVRHTRRVEGLINTCFDCHHDRPVLRRIRNLKLQTERYQEALSRVLTIRAGAERMAREKEKAFHIGDELIAQVGDMIATTGAKLEEATQKSLDEIDDTKYVLYFLVASGPLVSVVLGFLFILSLTSPVKVLLDSTRRLKTGDLDHRVVGLKNEFGELAEAFNEMAASLKEQMVRMQRTEQLAVVGELAAGLAHEIKNPLAGIKVAMEVLADEVHLSEEDRDVLKKVGKEVTRVEILMKSFLSFAKPPKPRLERVDINYLMQTTLALHGTLDSPTLREGRGIEVVEQLGSVPETMADPMQLQQVFLNLLLNAVDAMPDGGTLTVKTALDGDSGIVIEVADTGKGIAPDHAVKIFQPFYTTKAKGTGLGLPICRQLIDQHGGAIRVRENPGGGTRFLIALPLQAVEAEVPA